MEYVNPIIHKDFSDPDVIRVDDDFYMVASSFNYVPGVPILHSKDLVNWQIVSYILKSLPNEYDQVKHGCGVWAPSLRYNDGVFYCFIPFPDEGIYVAKTDDILGEWELWMLNSTVGMIDPCPIWKDGKAFVVCAFAKSRIGFNSVIGLFEMSIDCRVVLSDYKIIFDGNNTQPVIEGPKIYFINDYYYILAPAGSVESGWQTCLRSKKIMGPYEEKIVMISSDTGVNGPHQGALVDLKNGTFWFIHFQSKDAYGRIVHLQPVNFINNWPIIGQPTNSTGKPVLNYQTPILPHSPKKRYNGAFNGKLDNVWQFPANNKNYYYINSTLTLFGVKKEKKMYHQPNLLLQMVEYDCFLVKTYFETFHESSQDMSGFIVFGNSYLYLGILGNDFVCLQGSNKTEESIIYQKTINCKKVYIKMLWNNQDCNFYYSIDDINYTDINVSFRATKGVWVGARIGLFCVGNIQSKSNFSYFLVEKK